MLVVSRGLPRRARRGAAGWQSMKHWPGHAAGRVPILARNAREARVLRGINIESIEGIELISISRELIITS